MPISHRRHKHIAERRFCSLFTKEEHFLALLLTVCSCCCGSIYTTLLEKLPLRATSALLLLSSLFSSCSLFSVCNIKALSHVIHRWSAKKQRDRSTRRQVHVKFTLTAKDRECENREHPIERQDNTDMREAGQCENHNDTRIYGRTCHSYKEVVFFFKSVWTLKACRKVQTSTWIKLNYFQTVSGSSAAPDLAEISAYQRLWEFMQCLGFFRYWVLLWVFLGSAPWQKQICDGIFSSHS